MSRIIKSRTGVQIDQEAKLIGVKTISALNENEQIEVDQAVEIEKKRLLEKAHHDAQEILDTAKQQAELIKLEIEKSQSSWLQEREMLVEEAKKEGYQQGLHEGQLQGNEEYRDQIDMAIKIVEDSKLECIRHIENSEKIILDLGLKVAEKIIQTKINDDPEAFFPLVKHVLKEVRDYKEVHIHINPLYFSYVMERKDELDALFTNNEQCYVYPNDELDTTQCIIESGSGRTDASIDSQLSELKMKLLEELEGDHS